MSRKSTKQCGVAVSWTHVYTRSAMAMPESETALKELMWRILGDLLEEGVVVKIADNLTHLLSFFATGRGSSRLLINVPIAFQHPRRSSVLDLPRYYGGWARFQLVLTASLHSQHIPDRPRYAECCPSLAHTSGYHESSLDVPTSCHLSRISREY